MSLLGMPLLVLLGLLAVGLPVAAAVMWPRWRGPRAVRGAQRAVSIVLCQVSAVLLVAAALNDYGYFYTSWSELVGGSSTAGRVVHDVVLPGGHGGVPAVAAASGRPAVVAPAPPAGTVSRLPDPGWSTPAQWPTRGRVEAVQITGGASQLSERALVYLPPQYFDPAQAQRRFPAVEVLTGYPGNEQLLVTRLDYPSALLARMASGAARPMVLVMMRPTAAPPRDTECTDVPAGPQVLTYLSQDVPMALRQVLRVQPVGWAAMGDSTGGYCAAKIAMTHPDVFRAAVSLSGYFTTLRDATTGDLWGGSLVLRHLNDLQWRVTHLPTPPVSLLVTISRQELGGTGYRATRAFLAAVRPPLQVDSVIVAHGGHNFTTWGAQLPQALDWLSAHLAA